MSNEAQVIQVTLPCEMPKSCEDAWNWTLHLGSVCLSRRDQVALDPIATEATIGCGMLQAVVTCVRQV